MDRQQTDGGRAVHTRALPLACALTLATTMATAQTPTPPLKLSLPNSTINVNYVYAASLGFGGYSLAGLSANVYTLPLGYTLDDIARTGWNLRLLFPVQLGFYDFKTTAAGQSLSVSQQSLSVVPGAELEIPVTDRFTVKPFVQGGVGHTFGAGSGNPDSWIYLAGARSVAQWHTDEYTLSLGNGVIFAGDQIIGSGFSERYVALQLAAEIRRPLGFTIGGFTPDLGLFVAEYYYPAPLHFSRFLHTPLRIDNQNEVGFSIGSAEPRKILWLSNPRIGAGIVFGGGLTVYHVNFGFPF
jgi:hypothetical protein